VSQHLVNITNDLRTVATEFASVHGSEPMSTPQWSWPITHHAIVAAKVWLERKDRCRNLTALEAHAFLAIASGIARHDSKLPVEQLAAANLPLRITMAKVELGSSTWPQFLAVLCDELQDWNRDRPERVLPYRKFALEMISLVPEQGGKHRLALQFLAQDHPTKVRETLGTPGTSSVQQRLAGIVETLKTQLSAGESLVVELQTAFATRTATIDPAEGTI
jgi:hypothetical protein